MYTMNSLVLILMLHFVVYISAKRDLTCDSKCEYDEKLTWDEYCNRKDMDCIVKYGKPYCRYKTCNSIYNDWNDRYITWNDHCEMNNMRCEIMDEYPPRPVCRERYCDPECPENSYCKDGNRCLCNDGYTWNSDETACLKDSPVCDPPCPGNAYCKEGSDENKCSCNDGYTFNPDHTECIEDLLTCQSIHDPYMTWEQFCKDQDKICDDSYETPQCVEKDTNPCEPNPCQNGGICCQNPSVTSSEPSDGFLCSCQDGFAGQLCQFPFCQPFCPTEAQCTIVTEEGTAKAQCVCSEEGFQYNQEKNTCDKVGTTICQKVTTIITEIECPKEEL